MGLAVMTLLLLFVLIVSSEAFTGCPTFNMTRPSVQNVYVQNNQTAHFSCPTNEILDGVPVLVCREDLTWSGEPPTCFSLYFPPLSSSYDVPRINLKDGPGANHGRVEITVASSTFTVCQDGFDDNFGTVICVYLGYSMMEAFSVNSTFGPSVKRLLPAQLVCNGSETNLGQCGHVPLNSQQCDKEVAVKCRAGAMRLTNPYGYADEGRFEVFHFGRWNVMQMQDVKAVCRLMGFGYRGFPASSLSLPDNPGYYLTGQYDCDETDKSIFECNSSVGFFQRLNPRSTDIYAVYCFDRTITNVRLYHGEGPYKGVLEVEMRGRWKSVCPSSSIEPIAFAACSSTIQERTTMSYTSQSKETVTPTLSVPLTCDLSLNCGHTTQYDVCNGFSAIYVNCNKITTVPDIGLVSDGMVKYTTISDGTLQADVSCNEGYGLMGASTLSYTNGAWPLDRPTCVVNRCPVFNTTVPSVQNVIVENNQTAHFTCPENYILDGEPLLVCQEDFTWSSEPPTCFDFCKCFNLVFKIIFKS